MALNLTTSLAATVTKSELEDNFTSIQEKFNGGIDNSDIKASAGIEASKLKESKEYVALVLETKGDTTGLSVDDQYRDYVSLPGLSGNQNPWTLKSASWVCTDVGDGSTVVTFDVEWQQWVTTTGAGGTTSVTTVIAAEPLTKGSGGELNAAQCTVDTAAFAFHAANTGVFALKITNEYADALTDADTPPAPKFLKVTLLLERDIQA